MNGKTIGCGINFNGLLLLCLCLCHDVVVVVAVVDVVVFGIGYQQGLKQIQQRLGSIATTIQQTIFAFVNGVVVVVDYRSAVGRRCGSRCGTRCHLFVLWL